MSAGLRPAPVVVPAAGRQPQQQQRVSGDGGAVWVGRTRRKPVLGGSMAPSMAPTVLPTYTAPPLTISCCCW
ncbi:hypothetical protein D7Y28_07370 [Stenotrophomonas maltophilia]|nr:hypothetical protein [Stenotrophomonas maltophilia]